jgi:hypothetical protein
MAGFDREKTSPRQMAERTLAGIREGLNDVHADERSEAIWQAARTDPAGLHGQMQQQWDERATSDDPFEQDPDTSNVSE